MRGGRLDQTPRRMPQTVPGGIGANAPRVLGPIGAPGRQIVCVWIKAILGIHAPNISADCEPGFIAALRALHVQFIRERPEDEAAGAAMARLSDVPPSSGHLDFVI